MGDPLFVKLFFFFKRRRFTHSTVAVSADLCPHRPTCEADAMHGFMTFGPFWREAMTFGLIFGGRPCTKRFKFSHYYCYRPTSVQISNSFSRTSRHSGRTPPLLQHVLGTTSSLNGQWSSFNTHGVCCSELCCSVYPVYVRNMMENKVIPGCCRCVDCLPFFCPFPYTR